MKTIILIITLSITFSALSNTDNDSINQQSACVLLSTDSHNENFIEIELVNETLSLSMYYDYCYSSDDNYMQYYENSFAFIFIVGNVVIYQDKLDNERLRFNIESYYNQKLNN